MILNNYLVKISDNLLVSNEEVSQIEDSLKKLDNLINSKLIGVTEHFLFGSYKRKTNLPKCIDGDSDVDYLIVFNSSISQDEIIQLLSSFVENNIPKQSIIQSSPTSIIEINNIRFELVPAYRKEKYYIHYKIPSNNKNRLEWIEATPNAYNDYLMKVNELNNDFILPTIRILKYWNAINQYPITPYLLERMIMFLDYPKMNQLIDYFLYIVSSLNTEKLECKDVIHQFKATIDEIKNEPNQEIALFKLSSIIPFI